MNFFSVLDQRFVELIGGTPAWVEATVTTLLSLYLINVMPDDTSVSRSWNPRGFYFTSLGSINGAFSILLPRIVAVTLCPRFFNSFKRGKEVKKLSM